MRFKLISLIAILFLFFSSEVQSQTFKAALIAGLNASQINGDNVGGFNNPGIRAGVRVSTKVKDRIRIDTDMLFSQRGSRTSAVDFQVLNVNWKSRMDYVEVPVTVRFSDWYMDDGDYYKVYAKAGLAYGRYFRSVNSQFSPFRTLDEFIRPNDLAVTVGLGFYANKNIQTELNFTRSLFPFYVPQTGQPWSRFLVGYFFSLQVMYEI